MHIRFGNIHIFCMAASSCEKKMMAEETIGLVGRGCQTVLVKTEKEVEIAVGCMFVCGPEWKSEKGI